MSLICLKGHDNGRRFLLISLACYILLIILSPVFQQATILLILFTILSLPIIAASAMRRIHDAGFATPLAAIPVLIYLLNLFAITYIEHDSRWALLVLAVITTIAMATISNARIRHNHNYQMGYQGPIDLNQDKEIPIQRDRIEPTIAGQKTPNNPPGIFQSTEQEQTENAINDHHSNPHQSLQHSWEQKLGDWFNTNRKVSGIVIAVLLLLTTIALITPLFENETNSQVSEEPEKIEFVKERLDKIEMPDQFWMMLDQNDALTIGWEGDIKTDEDLADNGVYWSAATGKGDKDCVDLHFSLGEDIRALLVTVKNDGDYYADFSPVDTRLIVQSIANKDQFKLCGYEFVLKGTGKMLRKNKKYAKYLK